MSEGRKPLTGARLALVNAPEFDYCDAYHCAGDCGQPHNLQERTAYVQHALATFDALKSGERRERKDTAQQVRQRTKDVL